MSRVPGPDPAVVARDGAALVLTREALRWAVPVAVVVVVGSFLLRGSAAGVTALASATAVLLLQLASGWSVGVASRYGPQALQAVTLFGVLGRLALYALLLVGLSNVEAVDGIALAVTVVTLTVTILVAESRMALRYAPLWWAPQQPATPPVHQTDAAPVAVNGKDRS